MTRKTGIALALVAGWGLLISGAIASGGGAYPDMWMCSAPQWTNKYDDDIKAATEVYMPIGYREGNLWCRNKAQMLAESSGDSKAVSHAGAKGNFQLLDGTFREMQQAHNIHGSIFDYKANIRAGIAYKARMLDMLVDDRSWACKEEGAHTMYHIGPGNFFKGQRLAGGAPCLDRIRPQLPRIIGEANALANDKYLANIDRIHDALSGQL